MAADAHIVEHRQAAETRPGSGTCGRCRSPRSDAAGFQQLAALEEDIAAIAGVEPAETVEQRGLAGAVRADQPEDLALPRSKETPSSATMPPKRSATSLTSSSPAPPTPSSPRLYLPPTVPALPFPGSSTRRGAFWDFIAMAGRDTLVKAPPSHRGASVIDLASPRKRSPFATRCGVFLHQSYREHPQKAGRRKAAREGQHRHLATHPEPAGLGGGQLAGRVGRHRLEARFSNTSLGGITADPGAATARLWRHDGRTGDDRLRLRGAKKAVSAAHRQSRGLVVPGLFRAGIGLRTSPRSGPRPSAKNGHYVVNGQKTWTTLAQHADSILSLVRTNSQAGKKQEKGSPFC